MPSADAESLKGIHRVRKKTAKGIRESLSARRDGGRSFWTSDSGVEEGSPASLEALRSARGAPAAPADDPKKVAGLIEAYRASTMYPKLETRTRSDYNKHLDTFGNEFGEDETALFEQPESMAEVASRKKKGGHSPRQNDYAGSVVTRLLTVAQNHGHIAGRLHDHAEKLYEAGRSEIVWHPKELLELVAASRGEETRIVVMARETGMPPQDLADRKRSHVEDAPEGRRIVKRRLKTKELFSIPATPTMAVVIDGTPADREGSLVPLAGGKLNALRVSAIINEVKKRARKAKPNRIRADLRPYDLRGTRAMLLLRAKCDRREIAVCMGWSQRYADRLIEHYTTLTPGFAGGILAKLEGFGLRHLARAA